MPHCRSEVRNLGKLRRYTDEPEGKRGGIVLSGVLDRDANSGRILVLLLCSEYNVLANAFVAWETVPKTLE